MGKVLASALLIALPTLTYGQKARVEIPDWDNAVRFDLVASQEPVRPGDKFELAVVADIQDGYHLYGPEEQPPSRTVVSVLGDSLKAGNPSYPPPLERDLVGLGKYKLYEGRVAIRVPVSLPPNAKGNGVDASVEVAYQICTDYACSAPDKKVLALKVPGAAAGAPVKKLHADIFTKKQD